MFKFVCCGVGIDTEALLKSLAEACTSVFFFFSFLSSSSSFLSFFLFFNRLLTHRRFRSYAEVFEKLQDLQETVGIRNQRPPLCTCIQIKLWFKILGLFYIFSYVWGMVIYDKKFEIMKNKI